MSKSKNFVQYDTTDQITHHLLRPDMYIGSTKPEKIREYVVDIIDISTPAKSLSILDISVEKREITIIPGLIRIFVEILSNAIDNKFRSDKAGVRCNTIKVNISGERISIMNNGLAIP